LVFQCEVDVQVGNGRLNYINGYVAKDHDSVDVGLGEYTQKNACSSWLSAYRLMSKCSPGLPEVAIRMAQLPEFDRSYSHVLLYPPQPASCLDYEGRQTNFSSKMCGFYLQEKSWSDRQMCLYLRVLSRGIVPGSMTPRTKMCCIVEADTNSPLNPHWWWLAGFGMSSPTGIGVSFRSLCFLMPTPSIYCPKNCSICNACRTSLVC
jgi:hypothetical protein